MEKSDTPRTDAAFEAVDQDCKSQFEWDGWKFARQLERALATATRERDEARAALRMIADGDLYNADGMRTIARKALAATEAARKFCGVGELERAGYIPAGSADEREAKP